MSANPIVVSRRTFVGGLVIAISLPACKPAHETSRELKTIQANAWLRHVAQLPNPAVPSYTELNARIGWLVNPRIELGIVGQDLLRAQHPEFGTSVPRRIEFQRSIRASLTLRLPQVRR